MLVYAARGEGPFGVGETTALLYRVVHGKPNTDQMPADLRLLAELAAVYPAAAGRRSWRGTKGRAGMR